PAEASRGLPRTVLAAVADRDKPAAVQILTGLADLGFTLYASEATARALAEAGLAVQPVDITNHQAEELVAARRVGLVINTTSGGRRAGTNGFRLRRAAAEARVPCLTSLDTARALLQVLCAIARGDVVPPAPLAGPAPM
ncbi:MAG: carbamoyl-phosphate synthase large subunit, partial [Armatimonadetes bacterium]|nr:carbamoyl-phosphate synthase large subunit [Armatimonadota bacterium]